MSKLLTNAEFFIKSRFLGIAATAILLNASSLSFAQQFTDVTAPAGVAFEHFTDLDRPIGGGVAWADFDGDDDLYATRARGCNRLFINQGDGEFVEEPNAAGADDCDSVSHGVAAADMDNDGVRICS